MFFFRNDNPIRGKGAGAGGGRVGAEENIQNLTRGDDSGVL